MKIKILTVQTIALAIGIVVLSTTAGLPRSLKAQQKGKPCRTCYDKQQEYCCPHAIPIVSTVFQRYERVDGTSLT